MPSNPLHALSARIARTIPLDRSARAAVLGDLRDYRQKVRGRASKDVQDRLDAAILLLEMMDRVTVGATADSLQVVSRLLAVMENQPEADAAQADPPSSSSMREELEEEAEREARLARERARATAAKDAALHSRGPRPSSSGVGFADMESNSVLRISHDLLLGQLLVESGIVTLAEVGHALRAQLKHPLPLGQLLVLHGSVTQEHVDEALSIQRELRGETLSMPAGEDPPAPRHQKPLPSGSTPDRGLELNLTPAQSRYMRGLAEQLLGETLIRLGTIKREQLEVALKVQRAAGTHIGEALVETGAATWDQVKRGLKLQERNKQSA